MITLSKNITIMKKEKVSEFKVVNFKVLGDASNKKIGGSVKAENAMLVNAEELRSYLPNILGVSPTAPEWGKAVDNYVRSVSAPVESNGLDLEIGFTFDITDIDFKPAIDALIKEAKIDEDEKSLVEYITSKVNRNHWWRYGRPIEPADYFLWRYVQNHRKVANSIADADKSLNISFYIIDQEDVRKSKTAAFKIKNEANNLYFSISKDIDKVKAVLFAADKGMDVVAAKGVSAEEDLIIALDQLKDQSPANFIKYASNIERAKEEAFVQECIARGVLTKLSNTNLITDAATGETIGNGIPEVLTYFRQESNSKYLNEVKGRLKAKSI